MQNRTNWQLIEAALVRIAKANGYTIENDYGDSIAFISPEAEGGINLTQMAKDLEQELVPGRGM